MQATLWDQSLKYTGCSHHEISDTWRKNGIRIANDFSLIFVHIFGVWNSVFYLALSYNYIHFGRNR